MGYALRTSGGVRERAQGCRLCAPFGAVPVGRVMPAPCKGETGRARQLAPKGFFL
ncbi:MAG: Uncharacterised protein [SAR116 cluster bacterium]|nr:MAG: Uncharacterised protein [SAR116 cluster bacterium]